jgi:chromosome segregation ATPase
MPEATRSRALDEAGGLGNDVRHPADMVQTLELQAAGAEIAASRLAFDALSRQLHQSQQEHKAFLREYAALLSERDIFLKERAAFLQERDVYRTERNKLLSEYNALLGERSSILKEREAEFALYREATAELQKLTKTLAETTNRSAKALAAANEELARVQSTLAETENRSAEALAAANEELARVQSTLAETENRSAEALVAAKKELALAQSNVAAVTAECDLKSRIIRQQLTITYSLRRELITATQQLEALLRSTSWRITVPLRSSKLSWLRNVVRRTAMHFGVKNRSYLSQPR